MGWLPAAFAALCAVLCVNLGPARAAAAGQSVPSTSQSHSPSHTTAQLSQTVVPATVAVQWTPPAVINAGDRLSGLELNASAPVPGTFLYTPAAGTLLSVGSHTLYAHFMPFDSSYAPSTLPAQVEVVAWNGATYTLQHNRVVAPAIVRSPTIAQSTVSVNVVPTGLLYQAVHLTCEASPGIECTVTPSDVRPVAATVAAQVKVRIPVSMLLRVNAAGMAPLLGLLGLLGRRRRRTAAALSLVLTVACLGFQSCGTAPPLHVVVIATTSTQARTLPLDLRTLGLDR